MTMPKRLPIAALISGSGRTLKNFIDLAAAGELPIDIRLVISSTPTAGGLKFAEDAGIQSIVLKRSHAASDQDYSHRIFDACRPAAVEYVAMAGFVKFIPIPADWINRVINIHPALLPSFGGEGMYGHHVHEAVLAYGAKVSGCTVHFADNQYDHGPIIHQETVPVLNDDTPDTLAARVFEAETRAYPHVLRLLAERRVSVTGRRVIVGSPGLFIKANE
ncbi:MAG: phosphoribosylglycinamide formyltransferase [Pirellulales bacterium]|nr:phosphoribosylglycinamide formyltransferase [Pirellulales bacterium]